MKTSKKIAALMVIVGAAALAVSLFIGCKGKDYSSRPVLWDADTTGADQCTDQSDNDGDLLIDRYGYPVHCTVELPQKITSLGSVAELTVTGYYAGATAQDVYTIEVTTGSMTVGGPEVSWTTASGLDDGGPIPVTIGEPVYIGSGGVVAYFLDKDGVFNLVAGEKWTVTVQSGDANCSVGPDLSCYDPESTSEKDACANGEDDDGDTLIDLDDPGCRLDCTAGTTSDRYIPEWPTEEDAQRPVPECNDGLDNDGDGNPDMMDPDCTTDCDLSESY